MNRYEENRLVEKIAARVVELLKENDLTTNKVLTARQAAGYLGVTVKTVYNLTSLGVLPHTKIGRKLTFTEQSLQQYLHR